MANVTEVLQYDVGIYQIETTDPVIGGSNGIANVQAKQLANRTAYLKQRADQVDQGAAGFSSLDARLDSIASDVAATSPDTQNALTALIMLAETQSGLALREIHKTLTKRMQTGQITIRNTGIISGCIVTKGTSRSVDISAGIMYVSGQRIPIYAQIATASIAMNTTDFVGYVELYLDSSGDLKATALNATSPANTLFLVRVTVVAHDTADDLVASTLVTQVTAQPDFPSMLTILPKASVVLPFIMDAATYYVALEIVSFVGAAQQIGQILVVNKTATGFDVQLNGTADFVVINWTASKYTL